MASCLVAYTEGYKSKADMKIYQIYYNEETRAKLEPEYIPYFNENCTPFFENSIIRDLIESGEHIGSNYFGVFSPKLREKTQSSGGIYVHRRRLKNTFSPAAFENLVLKSKAEIVGLNFMPPHNTIELGNRYHPEFTNIMTAILTKLDLARYARMVTRTPIYFNHFVMTEGRWNQYTSEILFPAMDLMQNDERIKKLVWQNASYGLLPNHLKSSFGVHYYPYHTFICERLINIFQNAHKPRFACW